MRIDPVAGADSHCHIRPDCLRSDWEGGAGVGDVVAMAMCHVRDNLYCMFWMIMHESLGQLPARERERERNSAFARQFACTEFQL